MGDGSDMLILPAVVINVYINTIPSIPIWYLLTRVIWVVDFGVSTIGRWEVDGGVRFSGLAY